MGPLNPEGDSEVLNLVLFQGGRQRASNASLAASDAAAQLGSNAERPRRVRAEPTLKTLTAGSLYNLGQVDVRCFPYTL